VGKQKGFFFWNKHLFGILLQSFSVWYLVKELWYYYCFLWKLIKETFFCIVYYSPLENNVFQRWKRKRGLKNLFSFFFFFGSLLVLGLIPKFLLVALLLGGGWCCVSTQGEIEGGRGSNSSFWLKFQVFQELFNGAFSFLLLLLWFTFWGITEVDDIPNEDGGKFLGRREGIQ